MLNPIQWIADIVSSFFIFLFLFIGWEIYIKPRIQDAVKRELDPYLTAIFEKIDPYLPDKVKELTAPQLRGWLKNKIEEVVVLPTTEEREKAVDVVVGLYDPIANAKTLNNTPATEAA